MTSIPFRLSSAAVTPSPVISLPLKLPSYIVPQPQDGLPDFPIN